MPSFAGPFLAFLTLSASLWARGRALIARPHGQPDQPDLHAASVEEKEGVYRSRAMQWQGVIPDLWASLVIWRGGPDGSGSEDHDFEEADAATKARFVSHCGETYSIDVRSAVPDEVLRSMCSKAGGTSAECKAQELRFWKAYNSSKVDAWCAETYDWFAERTLPKCASKCTAAFCKERCTLVETWQDLRDKAEAYQIRYDQYENTLNRTLADSGLEELGKELATYNMSKCVPAAENVSSLKRISDRLSANWSGSESALAGLSTKREAAYAAGKAAREAASKSDKLAGANKEKHAAAEALLEVKRRFAVVNASLVETQSDLSKASLELKACSSRLQKLADEAAAQKAEITARAALLDSNKTKLSSLADEVSAYNKTKCAPALAEAAKLAEQNGNILLLEKFLKEALSKAEHKHEMAKASYESELAKLEDAKSLSASHMKAAGEHKAQLKKANDTVIGQIAEIKKFVIVKHLAIEIADKEKSLAEAEEANKRAKLALDKAELKMNTADSDLKAADKQAKLDPKKVDDDYLAEARAKYTTAKKAYGEAVAAAANSAKAAKSFRAELTLLLTSMKAKEKELGEKDSKLASAQEDVEDIKKKMNDNLAEGARANGTIEKFTNTSKHQLARMNETEIIIGNVTKNLTANKASQAEQNKADIAAGAAVKELERLVAKRQSMELQVGAFEASLSRDWNALNRTLEENATTTAECLNAGRRVDSLRQNATKIDSELKGLPSKIDAAAATEAAAEVRVQSVEKELDDDIVAAQKTLAETVQDLKSARAEAKRLRALLLKNLGEIAKAEGMYAHYESVLEEMDAEYEAKSTTVEVEVAADKAKLADIIGKIEKIRDLQKPMEAALGPMLSKI